MHEHSTGVEAGNFFCYVRCRNTSSQKTKRQPTNHTNLVICRRDSVDVNQYLYTTWVAKQPMLGLDNRPTRLHWAIPPAIHQPVISASHHGVELHWYFQLFLILLLLYLTLTPQYERQTWRGRHWFFNMRIHLMTYKRTFYILTYYICKNLKLHLLNAEHI